MENLIIVHPNWDGQFDRDLLYKIAIKIKKTKGQIVLLIDSDWEVPDELKESLVGKNYKVIDTIWDKNFGWVVMLDKISVDSAVNLFSYIKNKGFKSLTEDSMEDLTIKNLIKQFGEEDIALMLESFSEANLTLVEQLPRNSILIGGSIDACLKEILVLMKLNDKEPNLEFDLIYNG